MCLEGMAYRYRLYAYGECAGIIFSMLPLRSVKVLVFYYTTQTCLRLILFLTFFVTNKLLG